MKRWLDRTLGAVPMYTLVLGSLAVLAVASIALAFFDLIAADPFALLASLPIAVVFSSAASWLGARIVRQRAHLESSLITGLLVFFIMAPSLQLDGLLSIALASTVAAASKFLIAFRGRHIFNPAALGAYVFYWVPIGFPTWWIGTPWLQPLIIIAAFLILYRTQRLDLGLTFVVLAASIRIALTLANGGDIAEAIAVTFTSSQLIFFVGFMLSEPLTLPPRRWQRLSVAALVALLFAIPFSIGTLYSDPLLALLLGNLVAFAFTQRRTIRMTLTETEEIAPGTWELTFAPHRTLAFRAGQYIELSLPHPSPDLRGARRYFTISSAPSAGATLSITFTAPEKSSSFKAALLALPRGADVNATGIWGDFVLPRKTTEPLLLVAGGIGVTPFASQVAHSHLHDDERDIVLIYATSSTETLPFSGLFVEAGVRVIVFGPQPVESLPEGWVLGSEGRMNGDALSALVPDLADRRAYLSGPPSLVNDLKATLRANGARRIHTDYFSGY
ncbi:MULTISPECIES: oxidoreductase [unclassified Salinibacterium]|uniref:oxidoreductase n=1 Tax=unclassified Salinibacterium TaxID=2632331 RepID=UPI0018CF2A60|nr:MULTISPECIES: oxidoreductase [unclassified Salinibacterium]MBH0053392.1 oxidoreductase [Salinibacterium sp. SWN139]MBH0082650.1 oxidoreductase [Salinibacterium sp. SWN167]